MHEVVEVNLRVHALKDLICNRWINDNLISYLINKINLDPKSNGFCFSYGEELLGGDMNEGCINRFKRCFRDREAKCILIFLNTGRYFDEDSNQMKTYIGEVEVKGKMLRGVSHYSLAVLNIQEKEMIYCDSLGYS